MIPVVASGAHERESFARYVDKAEQQYVDEHGTRIIQIEEVTITARAPQKNIIDYSSFYRPEDIYFCITEDEIDKFPAATVSSLLYRLPGISIEDGEVYFGSSRGYDTMETLFRVDDKTVDATFVLAMLNPHDIAQIDFLRGSAANTFTSKNEYVISIYTKRGRNLVPKETLHIKHLTIPLGFQKPIEFYAPKYDVPAANPKPDLRTTIHWQPNITTDEEGKATFSFYTADAPSTYTVVIEGVTEDGKIVRKTDKIVVRP